MLPTPQQTMLIIFSGRFVIGDKTQLLVWIISWLIHYSYIIILVYLMVAWQVIRNKMEFAACDAASANLLQYIVS